MAENDGDFNPPRDYNVMPDLGEFDGKKVCLYYLFIVIFDCYFVCTWVNLDWDSSS